MRARILFAAHPARGCEQPGKSGQPPALVEILDTRAFYQSFRDILYLPSNIVLTASGTRPPYQSLVLRPYDTA